MKQHLFLTNRTEPLPRWIDAFADTAVKPLSAVKRPRFCRPGATILWLHIDTGTYDLNTLLSGVRSAAPGCPIIVLSNVPSEAEGLTALRHGAAGYASSLASVENLRQIALVVENGGIWVGEALKTQLLGIFKPLMGEQPDSLGTLSPRQREVAVAVATGATNKEVARALDITERTVKAHLSSIFEHLGVRDRVQLALLVNRKPPDTPSLKYGTGS